MDSNVIMSPTAHSFYCQDGKDDCGSMWLRETWIISIPKSGENSCFIGCKPINTPLQSIKFRLCSIILLHCIKLTETWAGQSGFDKPTLMSRIIEVNEQLGGDAERI